MEALYQLESYKAIDNVLEDVTFESFQSVDVLKFLYSQVGVCMYDPGMGKTLITAALMRMLTNEVRGRRFIMFVEKSQLIQTPDDIRKWSGLTVLPVTAESDEIYDSLIRRNYLRYDVLMLTHNTLNNPQVMGLLLENKEKYYGVFVDEAHKLSNWKKSSSAFMLRGLLRNFKLRIALTATPVTSNLEQLVDIAHMFDWNRFSDVSTLKREVRNGSSLVKDNPDFFINRTRRDVGIISNYRTHIELVEPHPHQENIKYGGFKMLRTMKGEGARRQAQRVVDIVKSNLPKRGLIYINQHSVRKWHLPFLEEAGIRVGCINGPTSHPERKRIMASFANGELDVVISSVTTALNLDCDYIIFVEFCTDIKQMMGRAQRGLNPKTLDLYFIFTQNTGEIDYFLQFIYQRSLAIQDVLQKDYSELVKAGIDLTAMT